MSRYSDIDRRTVVKALGAGAGIAVGFGAGGTASASDGGLDSIDTQDCDCFNEFRCDTSRFCMPDPPVDSPFQQQVRECCTCDGETICEDTWTDVSGGCCSG